MNLTRIKANVLVSFSFICPFLINFFPQEAEAKNITVVRTNQPPDIDGRLDDVCWKEAVSTSDFIVTIPVQKAGSIPEDKTTAFFLYDDSYLYIGVRCEEKDIKELVTWACPTRDGGWGDDCVEIFLDPNQTKVSYYQIIVNAKGIIYDLFYTSPREGDKSWDSNCDAKVYLGENYWALEVKIPFAELGLSPKTTSNWNFNLTRFQPRKGVNQSLFPLPGGSNNQPDKFGTLSGLKLDYSQYCYQIEKLSFGNLCFGDNLLSFNIKNTSSLYKEVVAEVTCDSLKKKHSSLSTLSLSLKPNEEKKVSINYSIKEKGEEAKLLLKIIDKKTQKISLLKTKYFIPPSSLLEILMSKTDYYLSEEVAYFLANVNLGDNSLKKCSLLITIGKDNKDIIKKKVDSLSKKFSVSFPISGLKVGKYFLKVNLIDKKGEVLDKKEIYFNRIKGPFDE